MLRAPSVVNAWTGGTRGGAALPNLKRRGRAPPRVPNMSRIRELTRFGQSVWVDFISRRLLAGALQRLVAEDGLRGLTSNPAIFEKAIAHDEEYRGGLTEAARRGERDAESIYERLAFEDIRMAADQMEPVYRETGGRDGFVSLEVAPRYAHDTERTVAEARRLWRAIARPNLMVKVPATPAGLPAIEALIAEGINVNVTLLFSVGVYEQVARAYQGGLARRLEAGGDIARIGSVASFFVSRIDTAVDKLLEKRAASAGTAQREPTLGLRGRAAIANAKLAYARYGTLFTGAAWNRLADRGAGVQRLLWASTSTKNPAYPDTLYVDELIGPDTVNTMPPETLDAFRDHGRAEPTLERNLESGRETMQAIAAAGILLDEVCGRLLAEGVRLFAEAYDRLLDAVRRAREAA